MAHYNPYGPPQPQYAPPNVNTYPPPSGPPPAADPPPYHDWTVIPDTALLPPPPTFGHQYSPTANASEEDSERGYAWCKANPLWYARQLTPAQHAAVNAGQIVFVKPQEYTGDLLPQSTPGHWKCLSWSGCRDSCLITTLPLYSALQDSPYHTERPKTIYFELKVLGIGRSGLQHNTFEEADAGVAIGFAAPPYPTFRLPGWERGSLGVHGDDGRKYVNDPHGGADFTSPWRPGDTLGIGMTFSLPKDPPPYSASSQQQAPRPDIEVFFTRNGKHAGRWDGNAELDATRSEGGTIGLQGECDLFAAVGVFGGVEFEVFFRKEDWMYQPS